MRAVLAVQTIVSVPLVALVSAGLVPMMLWLLRRLEGGRSRGPGFYVAVLSLGNLAVGVVALFVAMAIGQEPWLMAVSAPVLAGPFLWWVIRGLSRRPGSLLNDGTR